MTVADIAEPADLADLARNFDVHDPRLNENLFETLAYMRERGPVHRAETYGGYWVVVGYQEVAKAARDWRHFTSTQGVVLGDDKPQQFVPEEYDPPLHTSFRRLLNPFFTRTVAEALKAPIRERADALIDGFCKDGEVDLTKSYAMPIGGYIFFDVIFGFNAEDARFCEQATNDAMFSNDHDARVSGFARLKQFATRYIEERRGTPSNGNLIDTIRTGVVDGRAVTEAEAIGAIQLMIIGGDDTAVHAMGNMFAQLAQDSGLRDRLIADPSLMPQAVEESIRHQSPAVTLARTVAEDVELGGKQMRAGDKVLLMWGSANRDDSVFERPDDFDIHRSNLKEHVALGGGPHRCIGEWFARSIIAAATAQLLERLPDFRLAEGGKIKYRMGQSRGPASVPVQFTPITG